MKNKLFPAFAGLLGLGFALMLAPSLVKPAQAEPGRSAAVVMIRGTEYYQQGSGVPPFYIVYYASSSARALKFEQGYSLSEAIAALISEGYEIQYLPGLQFLATRR